MQECLNEDHASFTHELTTNPFVIVISVVFVLFTILFSVIGPLCFTMPGWKCPEQMGFIFLVLGITFLMFFIIFIILPFCVRGLLNCCYPIDTDREEDEFVSYNVMYHGKSKKNKKKNKKGSKRSIVEELV